MQQKVNYKETFFSRSQAFASPARKLRFVEAQLKALQPVEGGINFFAVPLQGVGDNPLRSPGSVTGSGLHEANLFDVEGEDWEVGHSQRF